MKIRIRDGLKVKESRIYKKYILESNPTGGCSGCIFIKRRNEKGCNTIECKFNWVYKTKSEVGW